MKFEALDTDAEEVRKLASSLEDAIAGRPTSTVINALCWVLASAVIQAGPRRSTPAATNAIADYFRRSVRRLRRKRPIH